MVLSAIMMVIRYLIMGIAQSTCLPHGRSNGTACPEVLCNVEALAMTIGYLSNYLLRCMCMFR